MKIVIASIGSRGDVQPYIALGLKLQSRGHSVVIATEYRLQSLVQEFGLGFALIEGDFAGLFFQPEVYSALKNGNLIRFLKIKMDWDMKFSMETILNSYEAACKDADMIIGTQSTQDETFAVAEKYGRAWGLMLLGPYLPSSEYPALFCEDIIFFSWMFMYTHTFMGRMGWHYKAKVINPWRENALGLPPINEPMGTVSLWLRNNSLILNAFSPMLFPKKRAPKDYGSRTHTLGFVFVPPTPDAAIDIGVQNFLAADPAVAAGIVKAHRPIVYIGFGSMAGFGFLAFVKQLKKLCGLVACRLVLISGWSKVDGDKCMEVLKDLVASGTVLILNGCPHDWLFPRMDCIIHHCGVCPAYILFTSIRRITCEC